MSGTEKDLSSMNLEEVQSRHDELVNQLKELRSQEFKVSEVAVIAAVRAEIAELDTELKTRGEAMLNEVLGDPAEAEVPAEVEVTEEVVTEPEPALLANEENAELVTENTEANEEISAENKQNDDASTQKEQAVMASAEDRTEVSPAIVAETSVPEVSDTPHNAIIAAAGPGVNGGEELASLKDVAPLIMKRQATLGRRQGAGNNDGDRFPVATIRGNYGNDRILLNNDALHNKQIVEAITSESAIVAAGGLCAPSNAYYDLMNLSGADRPVRDALPSFGAERGSVRFIPPPILTDLEGSLAIITEAEDRAGYESTGGTTPDKPCLRVECGDEQLVALTAISRCLTFGNWGARTFPEQVETWTELSIALHARTAEQYLLDQISACSTTVSAGPVYGAARTILPMVEQAVVAYRSRHRINRNVRLRLFLPDWAQAIIRSDIARSTHTDTQSWEISDAQINAWFRIRGVELTTYIDTPTGAGQVFGPQTAGPLLPFPGTLHAFLFAEGSFLHIDGGTLDLGVVRDSTLNSTNDYQLFAETWENIMCVGVEALHILFDVDPTGVAAPLASVPAS